MLVPFNHLAQPIFIEDDDPFQLLHIYLLDINGGKITEVREGETVGNAFKRLTDDEKNDAKFVFLYKLHQISII